MAQVIVLATLATKADEAAFLVEQLASAGVTPNVIDMSLDSGGKVLNGADKSAAMAEASERVLGQVQEATAANAEVILGIGGGTGGEIALQVMRGLPITFPKLLVTTLPFDPRFAIADNSIVVIPTLADIAGLNSMLREVLENAALMAAGLCKKTRKGELKEIVPSIGITALGATDGAVNPLIAAFAKAGRETTVFHANGFGGAAFMRFAQRGAFSAIVDLTPHELTRIHVAGVHADMPDRFTAAGELPRVVLPGALNFIGLGQKSLVQSRYLSRPHYEHSGYFTHVKLLPEEMELVSTQLAQAVNTLSGPCAVVVPMGGFSHHDRPGGAIEDPDLRDICLKTLQDQLNSETPIIPLDAHISEPPVTKAILTTLAELSA